MFAEMEEMQEKALVRRGLDRDISINILKDKFGETPEILDQIDYVKINGMEVVELTNSELNSFKEATKPVFDQWIPEVGLDIVTSAKLDMAE
jgi:hypothetical protein